MEQVFHALSIGVSCVFPYLHNAIIDPISKLERIMARDYVATREERWMDERLKSFIDERAIAMTIQGCTLPSEYLGINPDSGVSGVSEQISRVSYGDF
jgi:hypothetical protein